MRTVADAMTAAGFGDVTSTSLWEVRRRYADREDYLAEIAHRTGRSILHELDDASSTTSSPNCARRLPEGPVVEQDRWTLWRPSAAPDLQPAVARR